MSRRTIRAIFWLLLIVTVPVPYMITELEIAPTLRLGFLSALIAGVRLAEGAGGWAWSAMLALGAVQTVLYAMLAYAVAAFAARLVVRFCPPARRPVVLVAVAVALLAASAFDIYWTPLSSTRIKSSVQQVFD